MLQWHLGTFTYYWSAVECNCDVQPQIRAEDALFLMYNKTREADRSFLSKGQLYDIINPRNLRMS